MSQAMKFMNAKLSIGQVFTMGNIECRITEIGAFGTTPHYGFTYYQPNEVPGGADFMGGWMPCFFVDNFTGYTTPEVAAQQEAWNRRFETGAKAVAQ
jgi:hypothetical protein